MKNLLLVALMAALFALPGCDKMAIEWKADRVDSAYHEGWKLLDQKKYEAAEKKFREADSLLLEAWHDATTSNQVYLSYGADAEIWKALASISLGIGESLYFQGKLPEAKTNLEYVVDKHTKEFCKYDACKNLAVSAMYFIARIEGDQGKFDEAIASASWAIENADRSSNPSEIYLHRAIAYAVSKRFRQALADCDWILKNGRSQDVWPAYALKCRISLVTGDYSSTSQCGQKLVDNFPANSEGYSLKGAALVLSGKPEGYGYCRKALELNPNDSRAKSCLKIGK